MKHVSKEDFSPITNIQEAKSFSNWLDVHVPSNRNLDHMPYYPIWVELAREYYDKKHDDLLPSTVMDITVVIGAITFEGRYYGFDYSLSSGSTLVENRYESDHVWSEEDMRDILLGGEAVKLALEDGIDKLIK